MSKQASINYGHYSQPSNANPCCCLQGYLFRAAFLRRIPLFTRNLIENVLLCLVASGIESSAVRWLTSIELEWRDVLTARIHKNYFMNMVSLTMLICPWCSAQQSPRAPLAVGSCLDHARLSQISCILLRFTLICRIFDHVQSAALHTSTSGQVLAF